MSGGTTIPTKRAAYADRPGRPAEPGAAPSASPAARVQTSIILPAYNERAALPRVLTTLFEIIDESYEVIVVDDGSRDDSAAIAARFPCQVIRHERNRGKGAAVHTGLLAASGEYIIIMDADNTYPPEVIPAMVQQLEDHDFVRGVRSAAPGTMPLVNRIGNVVFDGALRLLHGVHGRDQLTGLYGLRRDVLRRMNLASQGFDLEVEIDIKAHAHQVRTKALPITYRPRLGEKKLQPVRDGWRILKRAYMMAVLYNPVLMFLVPAVVIWVVGPLILTYFHRMGYGAQDLEHDIAISLLLGLMVGLQFFQTSIVMSSYARHLGEPAKAQLLRLGNSRLRRVGMTVGLVLVFAGNLVFALMLFGQVQTLRDVFKTQHVISVAAVLILFGLQILLGALVLAVIGNEPARESGEPS